MDAKELEKKISREIDRILDRHNMRVLISGVILMLIWTVLFFLI